MWWRKSRANPHQPRQPCHDSTCPHSGTRSSNFQRHAPFAGRCRGLRRKTFARSQRLPPPHLAPRTSVRCARGVGTPNVKARLDEAADSDQRTPVGHLAVTTPAAYLPDHILMKPLYPMATCLALQWSSGMSL